MFNHIGVHARHGRIIRTLTLRMITSAGSSTIKVVFGDWANDLRVKHATIQHLIQPLQVNPLHILTGAYAGGDHTRLAEGLEDQTTFETVTRLHGRQTGELLPELMVLVEGDRGEEQQLVHGVEDANGSILIVIVALVVALMVMMKTNSRDGRHVDTARAEEVGRYQAP